MLATNVATGIAAGLLYGLLWWARAYQQSREPFRPAKLAGTLLVAAGVGAFFGLSDVPVTEATIMAALAANVGIISLLEPPIKALFSELGWFDQYAGRRETPPHAMEDRRR